MSIVKTGIENVLYPMMEKRRGNHIREYLRELSESEKLSAERLHQLQEEKLRALLSAALTHVPAYRQYQELLPQWDDWDAYALLAQLPPLTKDVFNADPDSFISEQAERSALIANNTGGSTGHPVHFYMDRCTVEHYEAARWRGLARFGVTPGSSSVMIWGNPFELDAAAAAKYRRRERWLKNRILISSYELHPDKMSQLVRRINRYEPEYIYGYASSLTAFARMMIEQKLKVQHQLKAVVSTAETLSDESRAVIKQAFSCPVVNEYGARDGGILAYDCPHGHLHINSENVFIEVVDPLTNQPCAAGTDGVLLVTDLNNFVQPRLRYRLEDVAALSVAPCPCGRALPVLDHVTGREDSMLQRVDGTLVHGYAFSYAARLVDCVKQFRVTQHTPSSATLRLVIDRSVPDAEAKTADYLRRCEELLPGTAFLVLYCDDIPPAASGKMRYSEREFSLKSADFGGE